MPKIDSIDDIEYLVFEGGGGKGVLFLGALEAFESASILPLAIGPGKKQIKGVAGSSIGALFAYLLVLGWDKKRIEDLWFNSDLPSAILDTRAFPDRFLSVTRDVHTQKFINPTQQISYPEEEQKKKLRTPRINSIKRYLLLDQIFPALGDYLAEHNLVASGFEIASERLLSVILEVIKASDNPVISNLAKNGIDGLVEYIYGLIFDRGLYPGFNLFNFLLHVDKSSKSYYTFEQLYAETDIHLVVTGTNTTRHFPAAFSHVLTPNFPVIEAIAISMHFPILFKPVWVDASGQEPETEKYTGFWIDGGFLNNLPIHAFDNAPDMPLNPNVLAIRIVEKTDTKYLARDKLRLKSTNARAYIAQHLEDLLETLLFPSEPGQLRTSSEVDQTIELFSEDLRTLVFETNKNNTISPVRAARKAVEDYFGTIRAGKPQRRKWKLRHGAIEQAEDQQLLSDYYWAQLPKTSQKTVAHSEGLLSVSGPGYSKVHGEFPEPLAPSGESESAFYVRRYIELSGLQPPSGRDYRLRGDEYATHAEIKDRIRQFSVGSNTPTGLSQDMCGNCRIWHQKTAERQKLQIIVADPIYIRVFNPDGTVDIYILDGTYRRTIPAGVRPAAGLRTSYHGIDW